MVSTIAASNKKRQQQCEGTPFMLPPLVDEFGFLANKEFAEQVMEETYKAPPNACPYAIEVMKELKMSDAIKQSNKVTLEVTPEENRRAWRKMKDKISSASHVP